MSRNPSSDTPPCTMCGSSQVVPSSFEAMRGRGRLWYCEKCGWMFDDLDVQEELEE
jgi:hypothetical protein